MKFSLPYFIAKRLSGQGGTSSAKLIINIATGSVALGVAVMIIAIAIVKGYQHQIRSKIIGFSTHIQVSNLDMNNSFETNPIYRDSILENVLQAQQGVNHLQPFAIKAGILKTPQEFTGIVLKGVDSTFDWRFLQNHLRSGTILLPKVNEQSHGILLSEKTANLLKLSVGDQVLLYVVQSPPRVRKFKVQGIYNSGFSEIDGLYAFVDLKQVQKINNWNANVISGYEIGVEQNEDIVEVANTLTYLLPYQLQLHTIFDLYPQLFDWLNLLDVNVWVIIILMVIVACINMITVLLILITERSLMIGLLRSLGATTSLVSAIFLNMALRLIIKGMIIGNFVGIGIGLSQKYLGWFKLDEEAYYLKEVPIALFVNDIVMINAGTLIVCLLVLIVPSRFVARISTVKTMRRA
ncbi:MAG: ABC transporter permease [Bacteroidia bacterium]|jgi:lipoprotein-releasing system permease protein|nr:ABC transporter permease [Bacteroidia bacterium]